MSQHYSPQPSAAQSELIDSFGGPKAMVDFINAHLGLSGEDAMCPQAVSMWRKRGIPYRYRAPIAIKARERGIGVPAGFLGEGVATPLDGE